VSTFSGEDQAESYIAVFIVVMSIIQLSLIIKLSDGYFQVTKMLKLCY